MISQESLEFIVKMESDMGGLTSNYTTFLHPPSDMDGLTSSCTTFLHPVGTTEKKKRVRKLTEKWTAEQTERLVQEVEVRDGTWNFLSPQYRDRNLREAQWQEVADILQMARSEVSAKWNSLRCSFRATFNRKHKSKSGQGAVRAYAVNPLYNSLKFLEPSLQIEANTTSNLPSKCPSQQSSPASQGDTDGSEDCDDSMSTPSTSRGSVSRRRAKKDGNGFSEVMERALETMSTAAKADAWDDLGNFVASNGREWSTELPQLGKEIKAELYELILKYQNKFARKE
ncbi:uncharacterized protein [Eurosta solidaginis]|uniref:uncharacterized protein n=1 Tax=Eurosta solidaginis TaxID=178769 RepID=UPI00353119AF